MGTNFEQLISKKTDEELMEYIDNIRLYTPDALTAILNEFNARGKVFPEEELQRINLEIEKKKENNDDEDIFRNSNSLRKNIVKDPNAPLLYSKISITAFSTIFTALFGSVLLALNVNGTEKKIKIIGLGVLFTALAIIIGNVILNRPLYVITANAIGGYVLVTDFWSRYVGKETKYRSKSILIPLIIAIAISGFILLKLIMHEI